MVFQVRGVVLPERSSGPSRSTGTDCGPIRCRRRSSWWTAAGCCLASSTCTPTRARRVSKCRSATRLPAEAALGAASWSARSWLGLPGLVDGAPADLVAYDSDPALDPSVLARPSRIVLRGRVVA